MLRRALKDARLKAELSQEKLAKRVGLRGRDHYGRVERGEESLPDALTERLAKELDADPWVINPDYKGPSEIELEVLHRLRQIPRHKRLNIWSLLLAMLDEASRSNAA